MKRLIVAIGIACTLLILYSVPAAARTYWLDKDHPNASNSNNANNDASHPWKTLGHACSTLVAGDIVYIKGGPYREHMAAGGPGSKTNAIRPINSGTSSNPIIYKNWPGSDRPRIWGQQDVSNLGFFGNCAYIVLDSLHFSHGYRGLIMNASSHITVQHCEIDSVTGSTGGNNNGGIITFANGDASDCVGLVVYDCDIHHIGDDYKYQDFNASGIHIYSLSDAIFRKNRIWACEQGIMLKGDSQTSSSEFTTRNVLIDSNWVDVTHPAGAFGIKPSFGSNQDSTVVRFNYIIVNSGKVAIVPEGPTGDAGKHTTRLYIYNNTIVSDGGGTMFSAWYTRSMRSEHIFNNICYNPTADGDADGTYSGAIGFKNTYPNDPVDPPDSIEIDHNLYYFSANIATTPYFDYRPWNDNATWSEWRSANLKSYGFHWGPQDANSKLGDPQFVTVDGNPYAIDVSSPAATGGRGGAYPTYIGAYSPLDCSGDATAPTISNVQVTNVTSSTATITWTTNESSSSTVDFGTTISYSSPSVSNSSMVTTHSITLSGLSQSTLYHFRVRSQDACGNERVGGDNTFTTAQADVNDPVITGGPEAIEITTTTARVVWDTNEPSTSQVEWGLTSGYGTSSAIDGNYVTSHGVVLMGLQQDTEYHYRVRSQDADGNEVVGNDHTFHTATSGENVGLGLSPGVSGTYPGYNPARITDGVNDPYGAESSTWASNQDSGVPHWVEIDLGGPRTVDRVGLCWAWNPYSSSWMTSQQVKVQAWNGSAYTDLATITNPPTGPITVSEFAPVTTSRIRIWQPANSGSPDYSSVIWLSELEVLQSADADTIPPSAIQDVH